MVSAPLLTYTFLLLPLQKKHGWIFLFCFVIFFLESIHHSQNASVWSFSPERNKTCRSCIFVNLLPATKQDQVSAKAPPWHLWGMPGRGESYSSCWPQQEHKMWLRQAVTAVRGNSGLIRKLGAVTASCLPISAWACLAGWVGARVCRQLTCIRVGWVLLCGCSSADCGGGVDHGQLSMKLSLGAFPAALRAACTAFGAWQGWSTGRARCQRPSQKQSERTGFYCCLVRLQIAFWTSRHIPLQMLSGIIRDEDRVVIYWRLSKDGKRKRLWGRQML